jgi:cytochrome c
MIMAAAAFGLTACGGGSDRGNDSGPPKLSGERLYSQCAVCHTAAPPDSAGARMRLVGPPLWGVFGRPAAAVDGFNYSRAMRGAGLIWDEASLDAFLASPQTSVPGTIMSYPGESDPQKRAALIAYLKTLK